MSKDQSPPSIVLREPSFDYLDDHSNSSYSRTSNIGRSNSAPQADNKFTEKRLGHHSKGSPSQSPLSLPHNPQNEPQKIQTLSDGVILRSPEEASQAAISLLASNAALSSVFQTPLVDSTHSQSSTRQYYQQMSKTMDEDSRQNVVWQKRERFISTGHSTNVQAMSDAKGTEAEVFVFPTNGRDANSESDAYSEGVERALDSLETDAVGAKEASSYKVKNGSGIHIDGNKNVVHQHSNSTATEILEESALRKSPHRKPLRQAQSEVILPSDMSRIMSIADVNQKGYVKLEEELAKAQRALALKDEEVDELRGIRERLMKEVSDFTASLFEEVNSQLNEAALREQHARRQLQEADAKIEVLSAEVIALKDLVLTSTPSSPNKHLHPQIDTQVSKKEKGSKPFWKTHRRSTSHHQFTKESREMHEANQSHCQLKEMDTVVFDEFVRWRLQPKLDFSTHFLLRIQQEDIQPCLNFKNLLLAEKLQKSVECNTLSIEPIPGDSSFPRKCCLSETHKLCNYKIRLEGGDEWYSISPMCRNRIAAVCDFLAYIRYIIQGLVKCSEKDMFVQVVRHRHTMAQARLGLI